MCGPHPYLGPRPTSERQQLEAAIERLERLKDKEWCADALLVIDAAKKHLQTLPKPAVKFRVWANRRGDYKATTYYFDTRPEAVEWITGNLGVYSSVSIDEVE